MAISAPNLIQENSAATPGLWNSIVTQLWANDLSLSGGTVGQSSNTLNPESGNTIRVMATDFRVNYVYASDAQTTPTAFAATQLRGFVSTIYGAVLMGYGTTADVTLMNRAGTPVLYVGPNTTTVTAVGAMYVNGAHAASAYITSGVVAAFPVEFVRSGNASALRLTRVNTSLGSPSAILSGETTATLALRGYNGSAVVTTGAISSLATESWSTSAQGTQLIFQVTLNGNTSTATALTIDQDRSATFASNITQSAGTAALQVITGTTLIGSDATDATNSTSGAFKTAGGMGIAKKLYVGTNIDAATFSVGGAAGADGTGTVITAITVTKGIVTSITVS